LSTEAAPTKVVFPRVEPSGPSETQDRGYIHGHAAGYAAGLRAAAVDRARLASQLQAEHEAAAASAREATEQALALLSAAAGAFQQRFTLVLRDAEAVLAESAVELAEAVLAYELDDGDRTARAALRRALSGGGDGRQGSDPIQGSRTGAAPEVAAVRLNPADIAILRAAGLTESAGVELVPDPALARGDAMAQYPQGWLDARLGTAMARARAALLRPEHPALPGRPGAQP
jgi:flagellar assembly protein FliH